jgi:hypothetical protein
MACLHLLCLPFMPQSLLGVMFFAQTGVNVINVRRWCQANQIGSIHQNEMRINNVVDIVNQDI